MAVTQNHWEDLLVERRESLYWWLLSRPSAHSNYHRSLKRTYQQTRDDALQHQRLQHYLSNPKERAHIEKVLDEIAHRLPHTYPAYKLKLSGMPFLRLIIQIYDGIYVNRTIQSSCPYQVPISTQSSLKDQFLELNRKAPIILLPNHKSYMDFLHITYIFFHNCLPLPVVAGGDNFKALGSTICNYLKGTGAFLVRRNAKNHKDVDSSVYFDVLRSYIESVIVGGENPIEFFMEGTRSRTGQVLRPKTGLLSMVTEVYESGKVDDIYIVPVAINYSRTLEEQLYVKEITPGMDVRKPKESVGNLISAYTKLTSRKFGKAYVNICTPLSIRDFHSDQCKQPRSDEGDNSNSNLTTKLAQHISYRQVVNTPLTPFNFSAFSLLFLLNLDEDMTSLLNENECGYILVYNVMEHAKSVKELFRIMYPDSNHCPLSVSEFLNELNLDRDGIIKISEDRTYLTPQKNSITFQTLLYYANPTLHVLIPAALVLLEQQSDGCVDFEFARKILSHDFLYDPLFTENDKLIAQQALVKFSARDDPTQLNMCKRQLLGYLQYYISCYKKFTSYLSLNNEMTVFGLNSTGQIFKEDCLSEGLCISKDLLKNICILVKEYGVGQIEIRPLSKETEHMAPRQSKQRPRTEEVLVIADREALSRLNENLVNLSDTIARCLGILLNPC